MSMSVNIFYYQYLNMDLRTKLMNKFKEKLKSKLDITRGKKCNFIKKKKTDRANRRKDSNIISSDRVKKSKTQYKITNK